MLVFYPQYYRFNTHIDFFILTILSNRPFYGVQVSAGATFLFIYFSLRILQKAKGAKKKPNVIRKLVSQPIRDGRQIFENKVVKPNNGPSAVLVLNGTSHKKLIMLYRMQLVSLFLG